MNKAKFFRDVANLQELQELSKTKNGIIREYKVLRRISLSDIEYKEFCANFKTGYGFLDNNIFESKVDKGIWYCYLVKSSILVMSNGFNYPRFVAQIDNGS